MMDATRSGWGIKFFILLVGAAVMLSGAAPPAASAATIVRVGGTGSALGAMKLLAEAYEHLHPDVKIHVLPSLGSTAGIKALVGGGIDLALVSRPLTALERQQDLVVAEYARSPFVFVTNAKVNKKDVTLRELEQAYSDPAARWPDDSRIRLVLRPDKDIDTMLLCSLSPGMERAVKAAQARHGMIQAITDQEAIDAVARTPGALGGGTLTEIVSENLPVNVLSFNGVPPGLKAIANGSYPLVKSFYLVTTSRSPAEARQFAAFVRSPVAGKILTKTGNLVVAAQAGAR